MQRAQPADALPQSTLGIGRHITPPQLTDHPRLANLF